jgi:hypothetical protein
MNTTSSFGEPREETVSQGGGASPCRVSVGTSEAGRNAHSDEQTIHAIPISSFDSLRDARIVPPRETGLGVALWDWATICRAAGTQPWLVHNAES